MRRSNRIASGLVLILTVMLTGPGLLPAQEGTEEGWTALFNGQDFDGWKFHLGKEGADNNGTFTVKEGIVICSGSPAGYMFTEKSYSNYTLRFEFAFKRPDGLAGDADFRGNSGCLIHIGEENALGVWPRSIEVQGMHRQLGLILPIPRSVKCKRTFDSAARAKVIKPVGEFNTFAPDDARRVLTHVGAALAPGGRLVLETEPAASVRARGRAGRSWFAAERGLFSDRPHVCLAEAVWDEEQRTTTERYLVIDAASGEVEHLAQSSRALEDDELVALLGDAGFAHVELSDGLEGPLTTIVARVVR